MWIESNDGITPIRTRKELPSQIWVEETEMTGRYEEVTVGNAATFGIYPLDTSAVRPDQNHVRSIVNDAPGVFRVAWVFDQATADANAAAAAEEAERQHARDKLADLQAFIDAPAVTQAEAVAELKDHARILKRLIQDTFGN